MKDEERKELEQEYENLKLLASFHEAYGVPENAKEREALINDILCLLYTSPSPRD